MNKLIFAWRNEAGINGTNESIFSAMPCRASTADGSFFVDRGIWWAAKEMNESYVFCRYILFSITGVSYKEEFHKGASLSVICVKD